MLKSGRGQTAAEIGAGVQSYAPCIAMGLLLRRVAVNDNSAQSAPVSKKLLADPEEVLFGLLLERNAGTNARMHEEIVSDAD